MISGSLRQAWADGENIAARTDMMIGASIAGHGVQQFVCGFSPRYVTADRRVFPRASWALEFGVVA